MQAIAEWQDVDRALLDSKILTTNQPAVLRGFVEHWPVVRAARQSQSAVVDYLRRIDAGGAVNVMVGAPDINGRFFYSDDFRGFNFESRQVSISAGLETLVSLAANPQPPAIAMQAIHVPEQMPAFLDDNTMPLLDNTIAPRIWISNRSVIAPHFDNNHNIACVVGGRRRFTVFPPEQVGNLYIGPLLRTPGGSPISTVDLREPDQEKFPRFAEALGAARQAVLEPGDALYIPVLWWHGVEALEPLNVLVNYWWNDVASARHKPILALVHTMALMAGLPEEQREAWRSFFEYFAFCDQGDPGAHLPPDLLDVYGDLSAQHREQLLHFIAERLK